MSRKRKIGIIGFGSMGRAIAEGIKTKYQIWLYDKDKNKLKGLKDILIAQNNSDLVKKVDTLLLAIKPQDFEAALDEIRSAVSGKLIISIAAGISTGDIERFLGNARVVRVMPNMPLKIGEGMSCLCKGRFAGDDDLAFGKELFNAVGKTLILDEGLMNAATAVSGSGPGYYFDIVESHWQEYQRNPAKLLSDFNNSLMEAAESIGFSHQEAQVLAVNTGIGSNLYLEKIRLSPAEAKKQITSKGGTTEAGLEALHKTNSLKEAVKAALKRAEELAQRE